MKLSKIDLKMILCLIVAPILAIFADYARADTKGFQVDWTQRDIYKSGAHLDLSGAHFELDVTYNGSTKTIVIPGDGTITTWKMPISAINPVCSSSPQTATASMRIVDSAGQSSGPSNTATLDNIVITCSTPAPTATPDAPSGLTATQY